MLNNRHIEQQMYLVYLPRWHPKIYNPAKMSQYLQTSWIPGLLAIIGFPGTLAQECCYFIADIILVLPECQHHLVWVYLRPYTFLTELWQIVTLSPYWWLLWCHVQLLLSYTAPCHLHTILWTGACCNHISSTGTLVCIEYDFTITLLLLQLID